ncbi:Uncharacterised protein [Escherichia coli]|nr:Uncharacterised protein [Escherichia coli]SRY97132.1 Uncharacterised protein [Escherichia coli]
MSKSKLVKNNVESVSKEIKMRQRLFMKISVQMNKHYLM